MKQAVLRRCELAAVDILVRQNFASIYDMLTLDVRRLTLPISVRFASFSEFCRETGVDRAHFLSADNKSPEGLSLSKGRQYLILYDEGVKNPCRLLFTLAHELGHIMLGHTDAETPYAEREADYFAASLLAPTVVLRYLEKRDGRLTAERLCTVLPLSHEAAVRRIAEMREAPDLPPNDSEIALLLRLFGGFSENGEESD